MISFFHSSFISFFLAFKKHIHIHIMKHTKQKWMLCVFISLSSIQSQTNGLFSIFNIADTHTHSLTHPNWWIHNIYVFTICINGKATNKKAIQVNMRRWCRWIVTRIRMCNDWEFRINIENSWEYDNDLLAVCVRIEIKLTNEIQHLYDRWLLKEQRAPEIYIVHCHLLSARDNQLTKTSYRVPSFNRDTFKAHLALWLRLSGMSGKQNTKIQMANKFIFKNKKWQQQFQMRSK